MVSDSRCSFCVQSLRRWSLRFVVVLGGVKITCLASIGFLN